MSRAAALAPVALAAAIALGGCRGAPAADEDQGGAPPAIAMAVDAARVSTASMHSELRLLGVTVARRHVTIRAPAAGRVMGLNVNSGDHVRHGEAVAHIVNREVEAAQAGLEIAKRLDPAHAMDLQKSVQRYTAGAGIAVLAPESGIVAQRLVSSGQRVADLDPLVDLIDPASIFVEAAVPIDSVHLLTAGMSAIVTSQVRPGTQYRARIAALSPAFETANATTPARLEFTGPIRIDQSGAAVEVHVVTESVPNAVVIPAAALFEDPEHNAFYVFVAGADHAAHRTPVQVGIRDGALTQITRGVQPGQIVITSGGYALSDGLRVQVRVAQN